MTMRYSLCLLIFLCFSLHGIAQNTVIELGPSEIALNEYFTITIKSSERLRSYSDFPDIAGMRKNGTSSSMSTTIVNGQITSTHSITENYVASKEGSYGVPDFTMEVNGTEYNVQGKTVKVGSPRQNRRRSTDPFDSFFGRPSGGGGEIEYVEIADDAFVALTIDKKEVYRGEGFNLSLSFFLSDANRAPMQFFEPGQQVAAIMKKIKPENCWEENFNIENIEGRPISIQGKPYTQYKLYQATFYPLNTGTIEFPSVPFKMIKYKVAKNPSFFGQNRQEDYKTFYTKAKQVVVKALPPHPLSAVVPVGKFFLDEKVSNKSPETGESVSYRFGIYGEGNFAGLDDPKLPKNSNFDFYSPNIQQKINREGNAVRGSKAFSYYFIPKEPGNYDMGEFFNMIYFDPDRAVYDTLRSDVLLEVGGESKKNVSISSNDLGTFYDAIAFTDNELSARNQTDWSSILINIFILAMLAVSAIVVLKK